MTSAEQVHVEMGHTLPALLAAVDDDSVAFFRDAFALRQLVSRARHFSD